MEKKKITQRERRHKRLRKKIFGVSQRPRLCIHRSAKNLSVQIIDDMENKTLLSLSTFDKDAKKQINYGGNKKAAEVLGKLLAEKAKAKGINAVIFDRGGYQYHGRIKAFADAIRKEGVVF
jgi:large subunit ribosomal protein L18